MKMNPWLYSFVCAVCFTTGIATQYAITKNQEPEAEKLIRLKAEVSAYEAKNTIHQWEWEDYLKMKGEIAVLESKTNIERK